MEPEKLYQLKMHGHEHWVQVLRSPITNRVSIAVADLKPETRTILYCWLTPKQLKSLHKKLGEIVKHKRPRRKAPTVPPATGSGTR